MAFLSDKPHPSESFPGFTQRVTLPMSGGVVLIRKLDVQAITLDAMQHVLSSRALMNVAQGHASEASEALSSAQGSEPRPPTQMTQEESLKAVREVNLRMMRGALVSPRLEELVKLYGGRTDLSEPDLGMGPDYGYLVKQIGLLNPDERTNPDESAAQDEEAARFPEPVGDDAGLAGEAVRKAAK